MKYSKVSLEKMIVYIKRFHNEGLVVDLDYFIDKEAFDKEKLKLKDVYSALSINLKKNEDEILKVQKEIQSILEIIMQKQNKYDRTKSAYIYASDFSEYLSNELKNSGLKENQIDKLNINMSQLNMFRLKHKEKIKGIDLEMKAVQEEMNILNEEKKVLGESLLKLTAYRSNNLYQRSDVKNRLSNVASLIYQKQMDKGKKALRQILVDFGKVNIKLYEKAQWFLAIKDYSPKELNSYLYMAMEDGMTYDKVLRRNDQEEAIR